MKAWLLDSLTGLSALHLAEVPTPALAPGEVLVQVHYAALNPADRYLSEGAYPARPSFPHILGRDACGVITQVAGEAKPFQIGDRVAILRSDIGVNRNGTFAEFVAVPADSLIPLPPGWSEPEAAGATLVYLTAYQALSMWGELPPSVVLITGASGGVGVAAIQLGTALGHTVLALTRSQDKGKQLLSLGAAAFFNPQSPDWPGQVKAFLKDRRVDLALDNIGGAEFSRLLETLGAHGRVSCIGRLAGPVPDFNTAALFFRRLRIGGVAVGAYTRDEAHEAWKQILPLLDRTGAKPLVDSIHPFEHLPKAFDKLAAGPLGKVLVQVKR
jgi:NADPH2:quinone reductase